MRRLIACVALWMALFVPLAEAHTVNDEWNVSTKRQRYIGRVTHNVFKRDWRAHQAQHIISCESKGEQYAENGQYLGYSQMGSYERSTTGWTWKTYDQIWATKRYYWKTGGDWDAWQCAPY